MTDTSPSFNHLYDLQQLTGQAAHLMRLERQLQSQRKRERAFQLVFALMAVFDVLVIVAMFTLVPQMFDLPPFVTYVVVGGLALEMAVVALLAQHNSKQRRAIEQEIDLITQGYTQS